MKKGLFSTIHVEEGPIGRTLFLFAFPVIISQLLQEFYNIADCAVVGHFAGRYALAAVSVSGLIFSVLINFFIGFSSGISAITSALFGAYKYDELKKVISSVIVFAAAIGIAMTAVMFLFSGGMLTLLNCPDNVMPDALVYLRICILGLAAQLISNIGTSIQRSLGDTVTPMILFAASVILNLVLDLLLVIGCHTGVAGAAAATVISQWILASAILIRLIRLDPSYSLSLKDAITGSSTIKPVFAKGFPAGLQALFMSISSLLIQVFINGFGADAMAGMTVFAKIEGFLYLPAFAYGIALTGFVGQNFGAGKMERIRQALKISIRTMLSVMLPLSLVLMYFSTSILTIFTPDAGILENAHEAVVCIFPFYVLYAVNQVFLGTVKGLGNTFYPMICTLICYALFRVIWCQLLIPVYATMRVIYYSYDVSFLLMLLMLIPAYLLQLKRK